MSVTPILYQWIHYKLVKQNQNIMSAKCIIVLIRRNIRLPPKQLDYSILNELEKFGIIYKINRKVGYIISQDEVLIIDPFF